ADSPQTGYHNSTGGVALGIDACFAGCLTAGFLGGYSGSDIDWNQNRAHGDIYSGYAGMYLSAITDYYYVNASVLGGWTHYYAKRNIKYPGVYQSASSDKGGAQISSQFNLGVNLTFLGIQVRPYNSFNYISQIENGFTEYGAGAYDLRVKKNNSIIVRNELGLQLASCLCFGGSSWSIAPQLSWVREVRIKGKDYKARFNDTQKTFILTGYFPDRNLVSPGFFLSKMFWQNRVSLDLYYKGEFGSKYTNNSFGAELRLGF
ncbi:MAG: autotransporter outer membrane beta-barrel domain-containing protein, partial [Chlamydiae bacterium]|nr:autotransporter outer membrane beta-barrel domain-containing protein [Chlamydiota bacterium]